LKRLLGYSSIAHAGYLLLGVAALSASGQSALLYYLAGYVFTVMAALFVITLVMRQLPTEDIGGLAGLNQRSPLLAATLTIAMVSLAGIPPLAGFFGKFLLLKAVIETAQATGNHGYYWLAFITLAGVIISLYYYFGANRAFVTGQTRHLDVPRGHFLDWPFPEHGFEHHQSCGGSFGKIISPANQNASAKTVGAFWH
jgi:NADH-quinone oxidoreductase subunit N